MSNKKTNLNTNKLYEELVLTTVSNNKDYSQMLNKEPNVQECDATEADSSTAVWTIKIFLN